MRHVLERAHLEQIAVDVQQLVLINRNGRNAENRHFTRHRSASADEQIAVRRDIRYIERRRDDANAVESIVLVVLSLFLAARQQHKVDVVLHPQHKLVEEISAPLVVLGRPWLGTNVDDRPGLDLASRRILILKALIQLPKIDSLFDAGVVKNLFRAGELLLQLLDAKEL